MIRFERRGITFGEVWFDEPVTQPKPDVLVVRHARTPLGGSRDVVKHSLVTNLARPDEEIWNDLKSDCRRKVRRAEELCFSASLVHSPTGSCEVSEFVAYYNRFAEIKGISGVSLDYLAAIADSGRLWLSTISEAEEPLVRHAYLATGSIVRFLYGGAMFRNASPEQQKKVSYAHRQLHWMDMVDFKAAGFEVYDWGGIFPDETQPGSKGINDFKRQFGGKPVEYFESERALTFRGQVYLRIRPAFRAARTAIARMFGEEFSRPSPQEPGAIPEKLALPRPG